MQPGCKETSKRFLRQDQGRRIGPEATGRAQDIGRDRSGSEEQKGHRDELIVASRVIDGQGEGKNTITNAYISSLGIEPYTLRQLGHETWYVTLNPHVASRLLLRIFNPSRPQYLHVRFMIWVDSSLTILT